MGLKNVISAFYNAADTYQKIITGFEKTTPKTKKPKDFGKIKEFLFKKVM